LSDRKDGYVRHLNAVDLKSRPVVLIEPNHQHTGGIPSNIGAGSPAKVLHRTLCPIYEPDSWPDIAGHHYPGSNAHRELRNEVASLLTADIFGILACMLCMDLDDRSIQRNEMIVDSRGL
jgi:hypothetical protein